MRPNNANFLPLTVGMLPRWAMYRPLAVAVALLIMMPLFSWVGGDGTAAGPTRLFQAAAQVTNCNPSPANAIIQVLCPTVALSIGPDLVQLETDAVNAYLALHNLPSSDFQVIYNYGRTDLRNAIRAQMVAILLGIIATPAASRTTHQQNLYYWLQALVQQNEISLYTNAYNQYQSFVTDPCEFTLNPTIAAQYKISYNGAPFCFASLTSLFGAPPVPALSYFVAYGMLQSYELPAQQFPNFGNITAGTATHLGETLGIAESIGGILAATTSAALIPGLTASLVEFNATVGSFAGSYLSTAVGAVGGGAVAEFGIAGIVAGPAAIILITVAIGVEAGMQVFTNASNTQADNTLSASLTHAQQTQPDLQSMANDSTGVGNFKIQATVDAQTLPDMPSTATLPAHVPGTDLDFAITPMGGGSPTITSTMTYTDWSGFIWSAQTSGGWFVQTCASTPSATCTQADSMIASIQYVDWSGVKWTGSRTGNTFVNTKAIPAATDQPCSADPSTGISPGANFSACSSYSSSALPLTDGSGNYVSVALSTLSPPVFTGSTTTLAFSPGSPSTQTIAVAGNPTPTVCLTSGSLTSDFSLNGGSCGSGSFQIVFNGNSSDPNPKVYSLTFTASSALGTVTENVNVNVSVQLAFVSPSVFTIHAGYPVNLLIVATGIPTPALSLPDSSFLPAGLSFHDNGNGTATISGTTGFPNSYECLSAGCGVVASNSTQGSVVQELSFSVIDAPQAQFVGPYSTNFVAGAQNQTLLTSTGASTPVSWQLLNTPPTWLKLHDNGNGTAYLEGTPPAGTTGSFTIDIVPIASGSIGLGKQYIVTVLDTPLFTSSNAANFTVGVAGNFDISLTNGTTSLVGTLPTGLTLNPGIPSISGTPAAGTGGQYTITLAGDAGPAGTTMQTLTVNVYERPAFTSPNAATCFTQIPCTITVTTTGYPNVSTMPVTNNRNQPETPAQGLGTFFMNSNLPPNLTASNLNSQGFATGTLTIQGTIVPERSSFTENIFIQAINGVSGAPANQNLALHIVPAEAIPAGAIVATASGLAYSRVTQTFNGTVTFKNVGNTTINGPLLVIFSGLAENVNLVNPAGIVNAMPYLSVPVTSLASGQSGSIGVQFQNPSNHTINFTPVVYSGASN